MRIRFAYLEAFKGSDTLLIGGDVGALDGLAAVMEQLAAHDGDRADLNQRLDAASKYSVHAESAEESVGVLRTGPDFRWIHDSSGWALHASKVRALLQRPPGHIYCDGPYSTIQVMVTYGEGYEDRFA